MEGTASTPQTYTVSGSNLNSTNGILITPPAGYEIGQGATPTYSTSAITVAQTSTGAVASTTISVRLTNATTNAGSPYTGNITHTSTSAATVNKAVSGTVTPSNTLTTGTITPTSYCVGSTGAAVSVPFTSTGTFSSNTYTAYLGTGTTTPIGTLVSNSNSGTITATLPATLTTGTAYRIHVEASSPALVAADNGANLSATNYGTNNVTAFIATAGDAQAVLAWTNPAACNARIVLVASTGTITATPTGTFTASAAFGSGTDLGGGQFVVYDGTGTGVTVTALANGTLHNFKAFVTNGDGYSMGASASATPLASPPTITTGTISPATIVAGNDVTVTFTTTGPYDPTNVFTAVLSNSSGTFGSGTTVLGTTASGSGSLTVTIPTGTAAGTTYRIRVVASVPTTTGSTSTNALAVAAPAVPTVTVTAVSVITGTSAQTGGNVTAAGSSTVTDRGVVYGTTARPILGAAGTTTLPDATGGTGTFTSTLAGLTPGVTYYVSAYATNGTGTGYSSIDRVFTTVVAPTITTATTTAITATTATSGGTASGTSVTARGVVYGLASGPRPGGSNVTVASGSGTGTFTSSLTGLTPGTTYYVAAYASNAGGTTYAADETFITAAPSLTVAPGALSGFSTSTGTVSAEQNYVLTGSGNSTAITVTASAGYEVSLTTGTGFAGTITVPAAGGTVYVRIAAATSTGPANGTITNVAGSLSQNVTLTGTVTDAALLGYEFTSNAIAPSVVNPNVTGSNFTRTGVNSNAGSTRFNSNGWPSGGVSSGAYVSFTFTPNSGYAASLSSLRYTDTPSATAAGAFEVRSSYDGYATALLSGTTIGGSKTMSLAGFTNITSSAPVTFRFYYSYASGTTSGTYSVDDVFLYGSVAPTPNSISAPTFTGTAFCAGATFNVTFTAAGPYAGTNDFAVQLSDASGLFGATPTVIGTASANNSNAAITQSVTIPALTANGTAYRLRVVSTSPLITGGASVAVTVVNSPTLNVTPAADQSTVTNTDGTILTANETPVAASRQWSYATTPGGTATPISGATTASYAPNFPTAGTYYVKVTSTFAACGTATSNDVKVTVTNPVGTGTPGELLLEDEFTGPVATKLTANGWAAHSGGGNESSVIAADSYSITGYPAGPAGSNKARFSGTFEDINRGFTLPAGVTTTYVAAVVNIETANSDYFLHLGTRTNTTGTSLGSFQGAVYAQPSSTGKFRFGVSMPSGTAPSQASAAEYTLNTPYLVVLKYTYIDGGTSRADLFVLANNTAFSFTEPTPVVTTSQSLGTTNYTFPDAVALRQTSNSPTVSIDGIRVASGWGAAVGKLAYFANGSLNPGYYSALTLDGGNATTTSVMPSGIPTPVLVIESSLQLTNGYLFSSVTTPLLLSNATISGGSASSFVRGPLARATGAGAATTVFPVGKGTFYRPITLVSTTQGAASIYTTEQFEGNSSRTLSPDPGKGTAPLARVSSKRFYTVNSSNTTVGNFTGTITLSFGAEDYVNVPSSTDFVIAKRDATGASANQWTNLSRSINTGTDSGAGGPSVAGTLTSASFSDFSDFTLGAQNDLSNTNVLESTNPLPVELTAFSAQRQADKTVAVKWATATEKNSARFEVQRSLDGREFATVATVAAKGNSMSPTAYATIDKAPLAAKLYYRLRQVDLDGTTAFSPVVTVAGSGETAKVELYPNPAHSRISFIAEAATPYRVLNQLGQPLLRGTSQAGTASIGLETLPTGLYFLELQTATGRTVQKFEKE